MIRMEQSMLKKGALDLGMKVLGCTILYGLGQGVGELMDQTPYVNQYIPQLINYVSSIDVAGNLNGVGGLIGLAIGLNVSGIETEFQKVESDIYKELTGQEGPEAEYEKITSLNIGITRLEDKINGWYD